MRYVSLRSKSMACMIAAAEESILPAVARYHGLLRRCTGQIELF